MSGFHHSPDPEDATGPDRYDPDPPLYWRTPVRRLGDPADDASMPIPYHGSAATVTIGVVGIVLLVAGVLSPAPFNGMDLLGVLLGAVAVIRTIWVATTVDADLDVNRDATNREPTQNEAAA